MRLLQEMDLRNKTALVRADLNVPLHEGTVQDDHRIQSIIPTLQHILAHKGKVVLCSHLGRPNGSPTEALSLAPIAPCLEALLKAINPEIKVIFSHDTFGPARQALMDAQQPHEIILLENLRFHKGEETNDPIFATELAKGCDVYVNDAFACSHRTHASIEAITHRLPSVAGLNLATEVQTLDQHLSTPQPPLVALIGGAKISTKLSLIERLIPQVDDLIIGGAMANTFLLAQGYPIGQSLVEIDLLDTATLILEQAALHKTKIHLPEDVIVTNSLTPPGEAFEVSLLDIEPTDIIVDIGPLSLERLQPTIKAAKTILWNGAFGVTEIPPFDQGTLEIAKMIQEATRQGAISIAGGGDTVAALKKSGLEGAFTYVSTAGGAFLEYVEGKALPGIHALT